MLAAIIILGTVVGVVGLIALLLNLDNRQGSTENRAWSRDAGHASMAYIQ
jgi:hypothetical protein